jgi:hypothetical protein
MHITDNLNILPVAGVTGIKLMQVIANSKIRFPNYANKTIPCGTSQK